MLKFPQSSAAAAAISLIVGTASAHAQSSTPDASFNGRDATFELSAGSTLRRGDKLTDMLLATVWQRTTVKGAGRCTAGACPILYNGEEMYARRSRLTIAGGDRGSNRGSTSGSSRFPDDRGSSSGSGSGSGSAANSGYPDGLRRLQRGDKGEDVRRLQDALIKDGARLTADGSYGRSTVAAVQAYQRRRSIIVDGVAGRGTLRALGLMS